MQEPGLRVPLGPALAASGCWREEAQPLARLLPPEFLLTSVFLRLTAARLPRLCVFELVPHAAGKPTRKVGPQGPEGRAEDKH